MGKQTREARGARHVMVWCVVAAGAALAIGTILQVPATVQGSLRGGASRATAPRSADQGEPPSGQVRALPPIPLSPEAQRELARAFALTAAARYTEARASCRALIATASAVVVTGCVAPIDAVTGRYEVARHALEDALSVAKSLEQQVWLYSLLGELSFWNGDLERAERALGSALALAPHQPELLWLHVDLLLDTGRARQALNMLAGQASEDGTLLREMLAYQKLGLTEAARSAAQRLRQRFARAHAQDETVVTRDEARFYASLPGYERTALQLARLAFDARREPWEARLLLEASLHADQAQAAQPALQWLAQTDCESPTLHLLASQLTINPSR